MHLRYVLPKLQLSMVSILCATEGSSSGGGCFRTSVGNFLCRAQPSQRFQLLEIARVLSLCTLRSRAPFSPYVASLLRMLWGTCGATFGIRRATNHTEEAAHTL